MKKLLFVFLGLIVIGGVLFAKVTTTKADGGSNVVELSSSIKLNKNSTLHREWIAINDDQMPVSFKGTPGVLMIYDSGSKYSSGGYRYKATYEIVATADIAAIEIRFITFDVFGEKMRNLSTTYIGDIKKGTTYSDTSQWTCSSENDAECYLSSIAYIAQVRTADGKVYYYDANAIVDEILKFTSKFSVEEFED